MVRVRKMRCNFMQLAGNLYGTRLGNSTVCQEQIADYRHYAEGGACPRCPKNIGLALPSTTWPLRICKISSRVGIRAPYIRRQHLIQGRPTQIALQIPESVTDTG